MGNLEGRGGESSGMGHTDWHAWLKIEEEIERGLEQLSEDILPREQDEEVRFHG